MNGQILGTELTAWRRAAGLTQTQLAERMQTKQSVISRIEAGLSIPTLPVLERFARACGRTEITLTLAQPGREPSAAEWDRNPSPAEASSLLADGLTRERFERQAAAQGR
jgi:transcriptional regulator with XRE-family HTH domain